MSSVVLWSDRETGVAVSWNKDGPYTVFVPVRIDEDGKGIVGVPVHAAAVYVQPV